MRAQIRAEIAGITPFDTAEQLVQTDALCWVDEGAPLFRVVKPATPPKHLVSYFLLIDGDHILLVDHITSGLWLPSGGHVDPGEHPRTTVEREVMEELRIPARFVQPGPLFITATRTVGATERHTDVSLWYVLQGDQTKVLDYDRREFKGVRWFPRNSAPTERTEPELARFLAKLTAQGL
ncbi:MAG: NUDIX hydrolase [Rhodobacteraceae bacterium]|nr:NUDIX hydrolase [Paracoccaceae bacterium]